MNRSGTVNVVDSKGMVVENKFRFPVVALSVPTEAGRVQRRIGGVIRF